MAEDGSAMLVSCGEVIYVNFVIGSCSVMTSMRPTAFSKRSVKAVVDGVAGSTGRFAAELF